jgi:hypothetical protein
MINKNLSELFAAPLNPTVVAVFDSKTKLYSSNYLINQYKQTLANSKYTSSSFSLLNNLINKKTLMPVYMSKNILSYSFYKIFGSSNPISHALAFYDPASNKIFILIDMNTTVGFASNEWIAKLTIHELMHMACAHGKNSFKKLFLKEYIEFYTEFFHILCEESPTSESEKKILPYVKQYINIFHNIEVHNGNLETAIFKSGNDVFYDILKYFNIKSKNISDMQKGYKYLLVMYLKYGVKGITQAIKYNQCKYLILCLKETYYNMTNQKIKTLAIQELIFPSEIIAVLSETGYITNKIPQAVKLIKS